MYFVFQSERQTSHSATHSHTQDTHKTERTLEKQDKAAEDKTVGGIFSRAWKYIGLAEPGKTTVKQQQNKETPPLNLRFNPFFCHLWIG
jgi:hypothetical protein